MDYWVSDSTSIPEFESSIEVEYILVED